MLSARRALCLIADRPTLGAERILAVLPALLEVAGDRLVVIDRGAGGERERLAHLERLQALCAGRALLMVSGRVDLALAVAADGVHLPERGLTAATVRAAWPSLLIGRSCHDRAGLIAAAGADYALLSPVAPTASKPNAEGVVGIDGFAAAVSGLSLPVLALGGVAAALAGPLRAAGAAGLATLGGVFAAADPTEALCRLLAAWDAGAS